MSEIEVLRAAPEWVVFDRARVGDYDSSWFDASLWRAEGSVVHSTKGRGSVLKRSIGGEPWVLRHYHRGGLV
jgi:3-deoxy-D-manno-octulosonic acid kinase